MVAFDEALRAAKGECPNIDSCTEYSGAYEFYSSAAVEGFGGEGAPVVVEKATGDVLSFVAALSEGLLDSEVGEVEVS